VSVTRDIARTYRGPGRVVRDRLRGGATEAHGLAILMAGCALMFVAQWPVLSRLAFEDPTIPLQARLSGALIVWVFMMPLAFYILAPLPHLVIRLFGGKGTWFAARLALFWALLAATPLWLLNGLVMGFIGPGPAAVLTTVVAGLAFVVFWGAGLWQIEKADDAV
jgi:hypothetical protein